MRIPLSASKITDNSLKLNLLNLSALFNPLFNDWNYMGLVSDGTNS